MRLQATKPESYSPFFYIAYIAGSKTGVGFSEQFSVLKKVSTDENVRTAME